MSNHLAASPPYLTWSRAFHQANHVSTHGNPLAGRCHVSHLPQPSLPPCDPHACPKIPQQVTQLRPPSSSPASSRGLMRLQPKRVAPCAT